MEHIVVCLTLEHSPKPLTQSRDDTPVDQGPNRGEAYERVVMIEQGHQPRGVLPFPAFQAVNFLDYIVPCVHCRGHHPVVLSRNLLNSEIAFCNP
jgi:hypothetical protein